MKRVLKDSLTLTKTGIVLGVGSTAVQRAGGSSAGLSALSRYTPVMGTISGAGMTLGMVAKLKPKRR